MQENCEIFQLHCSLFRKVSLSFSPPLSPSLSFFHYVYIVFIFCTDILFCLIFMLLCRCIFSNIYIHQNISQVFKSNISFHNFQVLFFNLKIMLLNSKSYFYTVLVSSLFLQLCFFSTFLIELFQQYCLVSFFQLVQIYEILQSSKMNCIFLTFHS